MCFMWPRPWEGGILKLACGRPLYLQSLSSPLPSSFQKTSSGRAVVVALQIVTIKGNLCAWRSIMPPANFARMVIACICAAFTVAAPPPVPVASLDEQRDVTDPQPNPLSHRVEDDPAYEQYQHAFASCTDAGSSVLFSDYAKYAFRVDNPPNGTVENLTQIPQTACVSKSWVIARTGPLSYTGDSEDQVSFAFHPAPHLQQPQYYAFTAYVVGRVDERGDLIPYPPLMLRDQHLNQASVGAGFRETNFVDGFLENHIESQCTAARGGLGCLGHTAAPGYAWFISGPIASWSRTFDVRRSPAEEFQAWQMVALKMSTVAARPVHSTRLTFSPFEFPVDRGRKAVVWANGSNLIPGAEMVPGGTVWHIHFQDVTDAWFFQGPPEDVFADVSFAFDAHEQPAYGDEYVSRIRDSVSRRQALPGAAPRVCSYYDTATPDETEVGTLYRSASCDIQAPLKEWVIMMFASPAADPPSVTCPIGATKCSPVDVNDYADQVLLHGFLRYHAGYPDEICVPGGTNCTQGWVNFKLELH